MSDVAKLSMTVLQRISEFLATLPEDQIVDIAEGRATLTYHPFGAAAPAAPATRAPAKRAAAKPTKDMSVVVDQLGGFQSRDEAERLLKPMVVGDLRAVAAQLGIGGVSGTRKADLITMLVERTIGARLNSAAVRQL
ncbi:Rho termination factor N-terminal domain-containing protein [Dactylosporangium sp. NBC_01737]|uniref:Rho termination factor N-terminal domain-containing protein n=1 Tax=Dactylosporangium sp. NBC_01737 TaxID=2975959 RepID=UPI002E167336|nr:Rho termination factor N-terminal domain-containing protein [Dactylosporangium sp. NBC_01737]